MVFSVAFCLTAYSNLKPGYFGIDISILLLKVVGLIVSILLLFYDLDKNNPFLKKMCGFTSKVNCAAVLNSVGSKIFGISWIEIGFFYFISTFIYFLYASILLHEKLILIACLSSSASTYIIFSVYYQWRVIKQWCTLCVLVQAILLGELTWSIINVWGGHKVILVLQELSFKSIFTWCVILGMTSLMWYTLKPILIKAKNSSYFEATLKRVQYNPQVFKSLLVQQDQITEGWERLGLTLGNPDGAIKILKVCNPFCNPCAEAHHILEEIIQQNNNVQLTILFITRNSSLDKGFYVVRHLLSIAAEKDEIRLKKALDFWYSSKIRDYQQFELEFPLIADKPAIEHEIELMSNWCDTAEITHTPTIFIDGFRLQDNYNIKDLKYLL